MTLEERYEIYLDCENDGTGNSIIDGTPIKTFDQWLNS
jgi:hypothetical protein